MKDKNLPKERAPSESKPPRDQLDPRDWTRAGGENPPEPIDRRPAPTPRPPDPPKEKNG